MKKYGIKIVRVPFRTSKRHENCSICYPPTKAGRAFEKRTWKKLNLV